MFHSDNATITGTKHSKTAIGNQDYSLTGTVDDSSYLLISDGCSSGRHTDLGSRFITLSARELVCQAPFNPLLFKAELLEILSTKKHMLTPDDWLATLGVAVIRGEYLQVAFMGDGHIIIKYTNGNIRLVSLEYTQNRPYYLAYDMFNYTIPDSDNHFVIHNRLLDSYGDIITEDTQLYAENKPYTDVFPLTDANFLAISTDGLGTSSMGVEKMAMEVCAIKSATGCFMKRRMGWIMRDSTRNVMDDFTVAAAIRST